MNQQIADGLQNLSREETSAKPWTGSTTQAEHDSDIAALTSALRQLPPGQLKPLVLYSPSVIGVKCEAVADEEFDQGLLQLIADMFETMYAAKGIGLAAPQIGCFKRVSVIHLVKKEDGVESRLILVNPSLVEASGFHTESERCLSLPGKGVQAKVRRALKVRVRYQDEIGVAQELEAEGLLARALQHECDHLEGKFFVQRASTVQRDMALRRFHKYRKGMQQA